MSGKSSDGAWWQVVIPTQYSSSGFGWVSAGFVVTQNTDSVPVVSVAGPASHGGTHTSASQRYRLFGGLADAGRRHKRHDPGTPFNTTWVLQNTGSAKWDQSEVDMRYVRRGQAISSCTRVQMSMTWPRPCSPACHLQLHRVDDRTLQCRDVRRVVGDLPRAASKSASSTCTSPYRNRQIR